MITIPIYIYDTLKETKLVEENERLKNLGLPVKSSSSGYKSTTFHFNEKYLGGFWVDPDIDDDSGTIDIIFYIHGNSYRTPYSKSLENQFFNILQANT